MAYPMEDAKLGTSISLFITLIYVPFNQKVTSLNTPHKLLKSSLSVIAIMTKWPTQATPYNTQSKATILNPLWTAPPTPNM